MPGFECSKFVELSEGLAKHLNCSICLNIFNNAVISGCGHTFCKGCVQQWIEDNKKECPECRVEFRQTKSCNTKNMENQSLVLINDKYEFIRDFKINTIINELKVKCDFQLNGCKELIEFGLLASHLRHCEYRLCKTCGFTLGKSDEHNCIELLMIDRNEWKDKFDKMAKAKSDQDKELDLLKSERNFNHNDGNVINFDLKSGFTKIQTNYILFGTHLIPKELISLTNNRIVIHRVDAIDSEILASIIFESINELLYCPHPLLPVLLIKLGKNKVANNLRIKIGLTDKTNGWFDNNSPVSSEKYIAIKFKSPWWANFVRMAILSSSYSRTSLAKIKFENIDSNLCQEIIIKGLLLKL